MKNLIFLLAVIASVSASAQNHYLGVKAGANFSSITEENFVEPSGFRSGLLGGLSYEYRFKKVFLIGAEVVYIQRGFKTDFVYTNVNGQVTGEGSQLVFNYDYISVPLKFGFITGKRFYGFTSIAAIPSLLVKANTISPRFDNNGNVTGEIDYDPKEWVTKYDFAGLLEVGGGYHFNNRYNLCASVSFQKSFTSITSESYFPASQIKYQSLSIALALQYALSSK